MATLGLAGLSMWGSRVRAWLRRVRQARDGRSLLTRLNRKLARLKDDVALLSGQVMVLGEEVLPLAERQALHREGDLELDRGVPSFVLSARMHRRHNTTRVNMAEGLREPILDLYTKTTAQEFAALHGVRVPKILGRWSDPDEVDWDSLPAYFVLKSSRGGGGANVYPLERDGAEFIDHLTNERTTREVVTTRLWAKHHPRAEYFAEEFLVARGGEPGEMPNDIKVFCFYGEVGYIEIRTGDWSRAKNTEQQVRAFLPDGTELHHVRTLMKAGRALEPPSDFSAVVEACTRLSSAIRRPMERLDFFETGDDVVFGELTQNAGRPPALTPEWDRHFGEMYERAYARLLGDLASEGALHLEYGDNGTDTVAAPAVSTNLGIKS